MVDETAPEERAEPPPVKMPRRTIGEKVRSLTHRLMGRLAPPDDETKKKPLRTAQKVGLAVFAIGAMGFWAVFLYVVVT